MQHAYCLDTDNEKSVFINDWWEEFELMEWNIGLWMFEYVGFITRLDELPEIPPEAIWYSTCWWIVKEVSDSNVVVMIDSEERVFPIVWDISVEDKVDCHAYLLPKKYREKNIPRLFRHLQNRIRSALEAKNEEPYNETHIREFVQKVLVPLRWIYQNGDSDNVHFPIESLYEYWVEKISSLEISLETKADLLFHFVNSVWESVFFHTAMHYYEEMVKSLESRDRDKTENKLYAKAIVRYQRCLVMDGFPMEHEEIKKAHENDSESAEIVLTLAGITDDEEKKLQLLKRALELAPEDVETLLVYARMLDFDWHTTQALNLLDKHSGIVKPSGPDDWGSYHLQKWNLLKKLGRFEEAIEAYDKLWDSGEHLKARIRQMLWN